MHFIGKYGGPSIEEHIKKWEVNNGKYIEILDMDECKR
jgi:hypothetical protein